MVTSGERERGEGGEVGGREMQLKRDRGFNERVSPVLHVVVFERFYFLFAF